MKSSIFNFLGQFSSTLEELALRVEDLLWEQPQESMMKARLFGETLVSMIFEQENMNEAYPLKQWEKINRLYTFQTKGELETLLLRIVEVLQSRNCGIEEY